MLAAGVGRRYGGTKQLASLAGRPLVAHVVSAAAGSDVDEVVVVVGHDATRVARAAAAGAEVRIVRNPAYRDGQASSLRAGIAALADDVVVAVVLLADQPDVRPDAIDRVVAAVEEGAPVARARYEDGRGHPVAFSREVWPRLMSLSGDRGARRLLPELGVRDVAVSGRVPPDVDTPRQLSTALSDP